MPHLTSPRRFPHALLASVLLGGLLAAPASGAADGHAAAPEATRLAPDGPVVSSAEVALDRGRQRLRTTTYSLVAATWRGPAPRVSIRTPGDRQWRRLEELTDGPGRESEGEPGLRGSELVWTGPSAGVEVRVRGGRARDLELVLIDPGALPSDEVAEDSIAQPGAARAARPDRAPRPDLLSRKRWGADPKWRNGRPRYLDRLKQVHLHHTATGNRYRRSDVPGIIRGMYRYHTKTLGWFDIGYNFLVDKFGRTWVGRSGGPDRLVQGAHTLGFNHLSVGVAVIGNHERRKPRREVVRSVARLAAWKLDAHDRRAKGKVWARSTGSDKYPDGERVRLPAFDGHRDTNDTACPGDRLYARLPALRRLTQRRIERFS